MSLLGQPANSGSGLIGHATGIAAPAAARVLEAHHAKAADPGLPMPPWLSIIHDHSCSQKRTIAVLLDLFEQRVGALSGIISPIARAGLHEGVKTVRSFCDVPQDDGAIPLQGLLDLERRQLNGLCELEGTLLTILVKGGH